MSEHVDGNYCSSRALLRVWQGCLLTWFAHGLKGPKLQSADETICKIKRQLEMLKIKMVLQIEKVKTYWKLLKRKNVNINVHTLLSLLPDEYPWVAQGR